MRYILILLLFTLLFSCKTTKEKRTVEYFNILKIKNYAHGEINFVPNVYSEGDIIYDKYTKVATFTLKVNDDKKSKILSAFKSKNQGMIIEDIFVIQRYNVNQQKLKIKLDEIQTYFIVKGKNTNVVQEFFNNKLKDKQNKENTGFINIIATLISPKVELLPFPVIDKNNEYQMIITNSTGEISYNENLIQVEILPEYKKINR